VDACRFELEQALATYGRRYPREAAVVERFIALCASGARALARDHFAPGHVTASAFILSPDGGSLLLIHHAKLLRWLQPGGHVEPADLTPERAARREALEEVGIAELVLAAQGIFDLDIHAIPARKSEPEHAHFDVRFLFRAPSLAFVAGSDASAARFVPLAQIATIESDDSVMRAVRKLGGG
jgi:8-oxo-dGTP pyrophosphatase MutT (NUDIX family)